MTTVCARNEWKMEHGNRYLYLGIKLEDIIIGSIYFRNEWKMEQLFLILKMLYEPFSKKLTKLGNFGDWFVNLTQSCPLWILLHGLMTWLIWLFLSHHLASKLLWSGGHMWFVWYGHLSVLALVASFMASSNWTGAYNNTC